MKNRRSFVVVFIFALMQSKKDAKHFMEIQLKLMTKFFRWKNLFLYVQIQVVVVVVVGGGLTYHCLSDFLDKEPYYRICSRVFGMQSGRN